MTMAVALLLSAVTVLPLLAHGRHEATGPVAHAMPSTAVQDHATDHQDADELIHHTQSHAQGVMPTAAEAPAAGRASVARPFTCADDACSFGGAAEGPFEPPRA